jgi:hypothetical protein
MSPAKSDAYVVRDERGRLTRLDPRWPRRATQPFEDQARRGAAWMRRVDRQRRDALSVDPLERRVAQESSGLRAPFSLHTFCWASNRKYVAPGARPGTPRSGVSI